ncbi:MAG: competence/damage-inducible protein, partial [Candidatus Eremiobacteraeota bacterium]|nr:competence/damage-inducible protein [Candidatus Eremiobacteraeota bacterium]
DDITLAGAIVKRLAEDGLTLATAESCTGGLVAEAVVAVAGASRVFRAGVVAYANDIKTSVLGVPVETLERSGAVSEETAVAMARGARERFGTDVAIATTGVAGPDGGTPGKPVGLVWFALATADGEVETRRFTYPGNRTDIRERATVGALGLMWRKLESVPARTA